MAQNNNKKEIKRANKFASKASKIIKITTKIIVNKKLEVNKQNKLKRKA